jgi:PAS domain S-box-containing protein
MATLAVSMLPVGAGVMHQRRAESAVRESEKGLRLAVAAGQMGTWDWSIATGHVTWSPELETIHGLARGTFAGTIAAFQADIHPEDRAHVERTIRESLAGGTHRLEYRIVRADGEIRWMEARGEVSYDEAGQPQRLRGICMDITSRKVAEAERERLLAQEREARARAEEVEQRLAFMGEIARSITASLDVTTVLQRIAEGTRALCRSDSAAIFCAKGKPSGRGIAWAPGRRSTGPCASGLARVSAARSCSPASPPGATTTLATLGCPPLMPSSRSRRARCP